MCGELGAWFGGAMRARGWCTGVPECLCSRDAVCRAPGWFPIPALTAAEWDSKRRSRQKKEALTTSSSESLMPEEAREKKKT